MSAHYSTCPHCGVAFVRFRFQRYCTKVCTRAADADRRRWIGGPGKHWARGKVFAPRRNCEICQRSFYAEPVRIARGGGRFCSVSCRATWQATAVPQPPGRNAKRGRRGDLGGIHFKSSWEANWARYLEWLKAQGVIQAWAYEPESFEVIVNGERKRYIPDFRIESDLDGYSGYHEVKGFLDARGAAKLTAFQEQYPALPILLVDQAAYETVQWQLGVALPHWEAGRVRNPHRVSRALAPTRGVA